MLPCQRTSSSIPLFMTLFPTGECTPQTANSKPNNFLVINVHTPPMPPHVIEDDNPIYSLTPLLSQPEPKFFPSLLNITLLDIP